ncbi:MAG TPA: YqhA family protein [Burkholderiales bacterium]|nr:YqhA family protein [Burkholderiales bacterium]
MRKLERLFELGLWNSRFIVVIAVVASMAAAIAVFWITSVDVWYAVTHIVGYADPALSAAERRSLHDDTVTHVVEVVDGYLLATVMLIFALGMYELFVSDIDEARGSRTSSKILLIETLDDLKTRLAKVILMILIVSLFEHAVKMDMKTPLDLLAFGGAIALVGLALYLTNASESGHEGKAAAKVAAKGAGSESH